MTPTATAPELEELVCFDLYAASRAVTAAYRPILGELGLTYPQYLLLVVLWERDECSIKDLATTLRLDHGTLTPLLRRMESARLLVRARDDVDERSVRVRLAERGAALRPHLEDIQCRIGDALGLTVDEIAILSTLLRTMTAYLLDEATTDQVRTG
ncbi:MAG: MarR family transcriptional regulator [Nocardioides sp.]|nr:MarR family transcriptional regulator [Nocardioides sp.]